MTNKLNKVFVVQRPAYYDKERRGWVNKYDLTAATKYGELVYLLHPGNMYKKYLQSTIEHLHKNLADYKDMDYILAIGDPVAISLAVLIAGSKTNGKVTILKYDRMSGYYDAYKIDIYSNNG